MKCLTAPDVEFDIGIVGVPFDTAVSYRPGEFDCLLFWPLILERGFWKKMSVEILLPTKLNHSRKPRDNLYS